MLQANAETPAQSRRPAALEQRPLSLMVAVNTLALLAASACFFHLQEPWIGFGMVAFAIGSLVFLRFTHATLIGRREAERQQAQDDLQRSEQRYEGLLNLAVDGILLGSPEEVVIEANECACELFGMRRKDLIGKHIRDCPFTPESLQATPFRGDLLLKGETVVSERTIRRADGSEVVVEMRSRRMPDGTFQSFYRDITERRRSEDEVRQSRNDLNRQNEVMTALLRNLTVGVFMVEAPSGRPLVANPAASRMLGRGVLPDADARSLAEVYEAYRLPDRTRYPVDAMPITLGMQGLSAHVDDLLVVRPDGTEVLLDVSGAPIKDEAGHIWASLVSFIDITEQMKGRQDLRESELRYRSLFELSSDALFLIDNETGRILDANVAAQSMYGYRHDELLGLKNTDMSAEPEQTEQVTKERIGATDLMLTIPSRMHRRKDGTTFPVEITANFLTLNGRSMHIADVRDISERRRMEKLLSSWTETLERRVAERTEEATRSTRQLRTLSSRLVSAEEHERQRITDVLHEDVQQLIVAARMSLRAVVGSVGEPTTRETLDHVDSVLARTLDLTRTLVRDLAVPAVGEGDIPSAIAWVARQVEEKFGLHVTVICESDLAPVTPTVHVCLYRAVQELLFNVVKHAGVTVARVHVQTRGSGDIQVEVSDRGCGFPEAASSGSAANGDGIGIFGIRERLEGLGGRLSVLSTPAEGLARRSRNQTACRVRNASI